MDVELAYIIYAFRTGAPLYIGNIVKILVIVSISESIKISSDNGFIIHILCCIEKS